MEIFFIFLLITIVITVVGHVSWLILEFFIRAIIGKPKPSELRSSNFSAFCPDCQDVKFFRSRHCVICGVGIDELANRPAQSDASKLKQIRQSLENLYRKKKITKDQLERMVDSIMLEDIATKTTELDKPTEIAEFTDPFSPKTVPPPAPPSIPVSSVPKKPKTKPQTLATSPDPLPRKTFNDLLQSFMEEKNIRWGELVSGMLIVGSAIGLVISLWSKLEDRIPFFPALIFLSVTLAIHSAGLYTLKKWKLQATSRGLLVISALLIPLNFLAAIALSDKNAGIGVYYWFAVLIGLVAYSYVGASTKRILFDTEKDRQRPLIPSLLASLAHPFVLTLIGPCIGQLLISRLAGPEISLVSITLLTLVPFLSFFVGVSLQLHRLQSENETSEKQIDRTLTVLGVAFFSLVLAVGLLIFKTQTQTMATTLLKISPALSLVGMAIMTAGLIIHQKTITAALTSRRIIGTSLLIVGWAFICWTLYLAWPIPLLLLILGGLYFLVLLVSSVVFRVPFLSIPSILSLAFTILIAFHTATESIELNFELTLQQQSLFRILSQGYSAYIVMIEALVAMLFAFVLLRKSRKKLLPLERIDEISLESFDYPQCLFVVSVLLSFVSMAVALFAGFLPGQEGVSFTTPVFFVASLVTLSACFGLPRKYHAILSLVGSSLFFVFVWHLLSRNIWMHDFLHERNIRILHPFALATLIHSTFAISLSLVFHKYGLGADNNEEPSKSKNAAAMLTYSAIASSCLAVFVFSMFDSDLQSVFTIYAFWAMTLWLVLSRMIKAPLLWSGAQLLSVLGIVLSVTVYCQSQEWSGASYGFIYFNQILIGSLAFGAILWTLAKKQLSGNLPGFQYLKNTFSLETVLWGISILCALSMFSMGCVAGIRNELIDASIPFSHSANFQFGRYEILSAALLSSLNLLAVIFFFSRKGLQSKIHDEDSDPKEVQKSKTLSEFWYFFIALQMVAFAIFAVSTIDLLAGFQESVSQNELYPALFGATGWVLLGILVTISGLFLWCERNLVSKFTLVAVLGLVPVFVAGQFVEQETTASALRWGFAILGLAFSMLKLVNLPVIRKKLQSWFRNGDDIFLSEIPNISRTGMIFTLIPVILLSFYATVVAFRVHHLTVIPSDSFFSQLGFGYSYSIPIFLIAFSILICVHRQEFVRRYEAAAFLIATGVCYHFLMLNLPEGSTLDLVTWVKMMQVEGVTLAILSLFGLVIFVSFKKHLVEQNKADAHDVLHFVALIANISTGIWAAFQIILNPVAPHEVVKYLGHPLGLAGILIVTVTAFAYAHLTKKNVFRDLGMISLFAFVAWPAAALYEHNLEFSWSCYHALIFGCLALNVIFCLGFFVAKFWKTTESEQWNCCLPKYLTVGTTLVMLLVVGEFLRTQDHLSLLVSAVALSATLIAFMGVVLRKVSWAYASSFLAVATGVLYGVAPWFELRELPSGQEWLALVEHAVLAGGIASIFWLVVEVFYQKRFQVCWNTNTNSMPVHHAFPCVGLFFMAFGIVLTMFCQLDLNSDFLSREQIAIPVLANDWGWIAIAILGIVFIGSLWDRTAKHVLPAIAMTLLCVGFISLDAFDLARNPLWVWSSWILAAQVVITGCLWMIRQPLRKFADWVSIPTNNLDEGQVSTWLPGMNTALVALIAVTGLGLVILLPERHLRIWVAVSMFVSLFGLVMLSCEKWNRKISLCTFILLPLAATQLVWAIMDYNLSSIYWLIRSIRLMEVLAVSTLVYASALHWVKAKNSSWGSSLNAIVAPTGIATVTVLLLVLLQEKYWFVPTVGIEQITGLQIAVVAVALFGFIVALITMALQPQRDPFRLSERGKHFYVYASEVVAALLFLHIYLTKPDLFSGIFLPYWPYIILGIAFFGAGVGELFHRRKLFVLSEPLHRTGAFLPLIPALAFWSAEVKPQYSTVLFFAGLIYAMFSIWRKSFIYSVLAALAGNAALWVLWTQNGLDISMQPQLWLIPPAVSVLIASQLNHRRLTPTQLSSIRYPALIVIYLSSTGDMFLAGIGENLWKPVILASLSILGVFAGIFLRVRAFLYLGTSFLMMSMLSMVWHSARRTQEVWPWWVFGIVSGLVILTIFGLFEKKRDEMRLVIDKMKHWDA